MGEAILLFGAFVALNAAVWGVWRLLAGPARSTRAARLRLVLVVLVLLPLCLMGIWRLHKSRQVQLCGELVARVETSEPLVALTFDDGPTDGYTDQVLAILQQEGVHATFFVTGQELEQHPAEAQRIVAAGHELGNHTYSHLYMIGRSYAFVRQEVERTDQLIRAAGYSGEISFRPPYAKRLLVLPYYLARTGRRTVLWDVEPESYPEIAGDAQLMVEHVLTHTRPGSIILLHVMYGSRQTSMEALPDIIAGLREQGYRFVTVSELVETGREKG